MKVHTVNMVVGAVREPPLFLSFGGFEARNGIVSR
jgi:hypothetical protein